MFAENVVPVVRELVLWPTVFGEGVITRYHSVSSLGFTSTLTGTSGMFMVAVVGVDMLGSEDGFEGARGADGVSVGEDEGGVGFVVVASFVEHTPSV